MSNWLNALSETEKNKFLLKLIKREPYVDLQLINRLKELALDPRTIRTPKAGFRKFSELQKSADVIQAERLEQERILARKKRIQELEALASKEDYIWKRIMDLIAKKQSKPYDEAVALLKELNDLAEHQNRWPEFKKKVIAQSPLQAIGDERGIGLQ